MGKMMTFLTILIFIDLVFLLTGQLAPTINSTLFNAILSSENIFSLNFIKELIGDVYNMAQSSTGILSLILGVAGVAAGFFLTTTDTKYFVPIATTLGLIGADFIGIYTYIAAINKIVAVIIISPMIVLYAFTVVEWLARKD